MVRLYYNKTDIAKYLNVSYRTIMRWSERNPKLFKYDVGKSLYTRNKFKEIIKALTLETKPSLNIALQNQLQIMEDKINQNDVTRPDTSITETNS